MMTVDPHDASPPLNQPPRDRLIIPRLRWMGVVVPPRLRWMGVIVPPRLRWMGVIVPPRLRWMGVIVACALLAGCSLLHAHVNASPKLRWWLFARYGADRICPEMLQRSAPLRLTDDSNVIGRFFPYECDAQVNDDRQTVSLRFAGTGYAWTPLAQRIGFSASATVEYRMDFRLTDDAIYVWGKPLRVVQPAAFQIGSIENPLFQAAQRSPVGYLTTTLGGQVMESQLASGFTVVRTENQDVFSLGILEPPARPNGPFEPTQDDRSVFMNETIEVHQDQVDFLGPFTVSSASEKLFARVHGQGPPVDVLVYPAVIANPWRDALQRGARLSQPAIPPISGFPVHPGSLVERTIVVPPGTYFLVVANTGKVGPMKPPPSGFGALGANTAVLSVQVELAD